MYDNVYHSGRKVYQLLFVFMNELVIFCIVSNSLSYRDIVDMSKNRFFVLSENALHYLDNEDTIRAYS